MTQEQLSGSVKKKLTKEEEMLAERTRTRGMSNGVQGFEYFPSSDKLVVAASSGLFLYSNTSRECTRVDTTEEGARLHTSLSQDGKVLGFVRGRNVFVWDSDSKKEIQVSDATGSTVMAGEGDFNHQEEFHTYRTYFISPKRGAKGEVTVCYLEMDESDVHIFHIPNPGLEGTTDPFRYPLTGTKNSTIKVKLGIVDFASGTVVRKTLNECLPDWTEYVPRGGWMADGERIWLTAVDRGQTRSALVSLSPSDDGAKFQTLHEQKSDFWVNVALDMNIPLHFFKDGSILIASEEVNGYAHLYVLSQNGNMSPLTKGEWQVDVKVRYTENQNNLWVDEEHQAVFFLGRKDSVLETHLYCASVNEPGDCARLSLPGLSHDVKMGADCSMYVDVCSNLNTPPKVSLMKVVWEAGQKFPKAESVMEDPRTIIWASQPAPFKFSPPKPFTVNNGGYELHGVVYLPPNHDPAVRYPTLIYTYGGPHVQLVENDYQLTRGPRSSRWQLFASMGYVVSVLDNRGSLNRGVKFEGELRWSMGTVEIEDQVAHVKYLVEKGITDPKRVAIWGSSYGGYMTLMAMCKHPEVFKIGYSFAPVTLWEAYDTGYTERYMGLPSENPEGYKNGSVLTHAEGFPDEESRLVIFHGLCDENVHFCHTSMLIDKLISFNKPYELQVSPQDRHGVARAGIQTASMMTRHMKKNL